MDSLGIYHFGLYTDSIASEKIMMLKKNGFRIALLNYTYGINGSNVPKGAYVNQIDTIRILKDIKRARAEYATHIIAFMHWGNEYQRKSSSAQRRVGLWLRRNGVDVVIGSHPHVVQEIDTLNRIVYSLGNFISNQKDPYTDSGITVRLTLEKARTPQIEYIPHWCDKFTHTRKQKYRIVTERDTLLILNPKIRTHFRKALNDAREAVGAAKEFKI